MTASARRTPTPGSVVVGLDDSTGAAHALAWAAEQAAREDRPLTLLHGIPFLLIRERDVPADLDVIEGKLGLLEILTECGNEFGKLVRKCRDYLWVRVGLALVPKDAAYAAAGGENPPVCGTVQRVTLLIA